jgi:hypothetical protein
MKYKSLAGAALLALGGGLVASSVASAATIYIGFEEAGYNGGAIVQQGSGTADIGVATGLSSYGTFQVVSSTSSGDAYVSPGFGAQVLTKVNTKEPAAHTLNVYVTETGLTGSPAPISFGSGLTDNVLTNGWKVVESVYVNPNNAKFATVDLIAQETFTSVNAVGFNIPNSLTVTGTYSITELFSITAPAQSKGLSSSTENVFAAVPETSTWAMMLAGFAGLGFVGYSRNRKVGVEA